MMTCQAAAPCDRLRMDAEPDSAPQTTPGGKSAETPRPPPPHTQFPPQSSGMSGKSSGLKILGLPDCWRSRCSSGEELAC